MSEKVDKVNYFRGMQDTNIARLVDRFMRRIHGRLRARAPEFDTERVGPGGGMILMTLADIEPAPIQELVRRMARDKSQMTRAIKSLEDKGLVERGDSPEDARVCLLRLTKQGHATVERIRRALADVLNEILEPLAPGERLKLTEFLERIAMK